MYIPNRQTDYQQRFRAARMLPLILIVISLACSLPAIGRPTPTSLPPSQTPTTPPSPTPTPQPLPAGLVESNPPQSAEMPLEGPITLYFNQPMDRASVEAALSSQLEQELTFTWTDDSTVVIYLSQALQPDSALTLGLDTGVRSAQGQAMLQPVSLRYQTAGYLRLVQNLPETGALDVDPTSAIVAGFNRPVVPLGADPAALPAAFSLEPAAQGSGEWINTSTYAFYPDPPLAGGQQYSANLNPELKSTDGGPLQGAQTWSFTTALPRLVSVEPVTEIPWPLDAEVVLSFNQPMDPVSVEANFSLLAPNGSPVMGSSSWNEDSTVFTFTPASLLERETTYILNLNGQAQARGGTQLGDSLNASVISMPALSVYRSEPVQGGQMDPNASPVLYFTAPIQDKDVLDYVDVEPSVANQDYWWDGETQALYLYGSYLPSTAYTLTISSNLPDAWGQPMGQEFVLNFSSSPLRPNLVVSMTGDDLFLTTGDPSLIIQAANLPSVPLTVGSVSLTDLFRMLGGPDGYEFRQSYQSLDQQSWEQPLELQPDRVQPAELYLSPDRKPLQPGLYFMRLNLQEQGIYNGPFLIVVSDLQLTFKVSPTEALVWAVDLRTNTALPNTPVNIYGEDGATLASGQTDDQGVFRAPIPPLENPYSLTYAVAGQPGQETFGMALSSWSQGVEPWEFDIQAYPSPPGLKVYLYTDRPIYRPGQTVYFRAIARQAYNGRYSPPDIASLPLSFTGELGQELASFDLPLSAFGSAHGEYLLSPNAAPGYYSIYSSASPDTTLSFQVANYRKPEINLQVDLNPSQVLSGQQLNAQINARYFFDAPAGNLPVHWALYATKSTFNLGGYQVGPADTDWLQAFRIPDFLGPLGVKISEGDAQTAPDGTLALDFPTEVKNSRQHYTLEATIQDESGLPVSARASADANPDQFYIGVRPDDWVSQAGEQTGFDVQVVDWEKSPAGIRNLRAEFSQVIWSQHDPDPNDPFREPIYTPQYTLIGSTDFSTEEMGRARLAFTPPAPGTYQLSVFNPLAGDEQGARTELVLWVGGPGQATWPNLPNSRLHLIADKDKYQPGETAQVFIPNPFGAQALALVTLERGALLSQQVISIQAGGYNLALPLSAQEAPNVYVSVTLLGRDAQQEPDFRQGYLNLEVEPLEQTLKVNLSSQPQRAGPGDEVSLEVQVSDSSGRPVQGEFSLSVVDLAVLALADPNAPGIVAAFYGQQPNGVTTGLSLAAYNRRSLKLPGGLGGGGEGEVAPVVRENFPDTAYWNAEILTDADGKAQVQTQLPDTLTTWQVDTRGLTADTLVGQAQSQIITTKELLVRPVTPRFLVVGDHVQLAAVVQNNTDYDMQVEAALQATGFQLDEANMEAQQASVPASGRTRLEWWGTVQDVASADLIFSVQGKEPAAAQSLQDAARPSQGMLPVLRFVAPQAFRTAGTMDDGGEVMELVSLPRSFETQGGELDVELSSSLAAAMLKALDVLESYPFESTEQILSSFLPNLETYLALQDYGLDASALKTSLDRNLNDGLQRLQGRQNSDGGWGWWQGDESDIYITSYVLFGLSRARDAGVSIDLDMLRKGTDYLQNQSLAPESGPGLETWQADRDVFRLFVLTRLGENNLNEASAAYQDRDRLSPWAKALLTVTLEQLSPGSQEGRNLLSELETQAIRSASGAYWEFSQDPAGLLAARRNMHTTLSNSAVVLYALAQRDPGSPLVAEALRYVMENRGGDGAWGSTYTTSWSLMALSEVIRGTGELGGDFAFSASVNGNTIAQGEAAGAEQLTPVSAQLPASRLYAESPNALVIQRDPGQGRLYYAATLNLDRPAEQVSPLSQGLSLERAYFLGEQDCSKTQCTPIQSATVGKRVNVRLTLTLPQDAYFLALEDTIPAGSEILDLSLKTSQVGEGGAPQTETLYDPRRPFAKGWGWWLFNPARIYDDRIAWTADYLPAGTYELVYTLVLSQPGEYRALPAHAWQLYFPDVQAYTAGGVFEIKP
jgi:uncharacterized protein YfaS (alpha-2-macroglobulin family)